MRKKPVPNLRAPAKTKPASQKRSREQPLPPAESERATTGVTAAGPRAIIRVYRHGLGDCILVQLKRAGGNDFKILIDCGVAVATQDAPSKMKKVLEDVVQSTKGKIDVLAVTHEHWDHVSGFSQAQDVLGRLDVGAVWVAWTEDETDDLAKSLRQQQDQAVAAVAASAQATAMAGDPDRAQGLLDVLGLLGAAGEKTKAALDIAKAKAPNGEKPRYWRPTDPPFQVPGTDIRIYALGPPHDLTLIRKILPSKSHPETYELALDGSGIFPLGVKSALDFSDQDVPFADRWMIPLEQARGVPFFQTRYWSPLGESSDWRRIDSDWLGVADDLALALQSATNNTSLVLAVEFAGGDVLLFAGDAQVGNWLSWQDLKWPQGTGPDLLARTVFYKVGHHGSHNATLREKGLEMMKKLRTAVIPVDQEVAKKMRWGAMPLESLVAALGKQTDKTNGQTLRTDIAPQHTVDGITATDLYYEIAV
ncbi:MAG: MBL fold metallo-hydrolase [Xanthobacteraceae bacterium]